MITNYFISLPLSSQTAYLICKSGMLEKCQKYWQNGNGVAHKILVKFIYRFPLHIEILNEDSHAISMALGIEVLYIVRQYYVFLQYLVMAIVQTCT